jgi:hypothetical protein
MNYEELGDRIRWFKYRYSGYESRELVSPSDFIELTEVVISLLNKIEELEKEIEALE